MKPPFKVPKNQVSTEQVIKHSRFICHLGHAETIQEAESGIYKVRQLHPQARHVCWAFIAGSPGSGPKGMSDDGEPKGTAGKPMLAILEYSGLGEVWTTVTRYFGGIKLGTGGLVRAYSSSVQQSLQFVETITKEQMTSGRITTDYNLFATIVKMLEEEKTTIVKQDFLEKVHLTVNIPSARIFEVQKRLSDISNGVVELDAG